MFPPLVSYHYIKGNKVITTYFEENIPDKTYLIKIIEDNGLHDCTISFLTPDVSFFKSIEVNDNEDINIDSIILSLLNQLK